MINKFNALIALFMGYNQEIVNGEVYFTLDDMLEALSMEELHYHDDWNWLIAAVEKCVTLPDATTFTNYQQYHDELHNALWSLNIDTTFRSVVTFINWYNLKKE